MDKWPETFRNLLHAEELQQSYDIGIHDMRAQVTQTSQRSNLCSLKRWKKKVKFNAC